MPNISNKEKMRLQEAKEGVKDWKRWGPYLSERQWGTVREDHSDNNDCWHYLTHDAASSRAYRWGEDGLLGITDDECRLCLALCLWNGKDGMFKERLFGLTNPQGNHGEDVKELYYYLDNTPTHSYMKGLYKYPQNEFPYKDLIQKNARALLNIEKMNASNLMGIESAVSSVEEQEIVTESSSDFIHDPNMFTESINIPLDKQEIREFELLDTEIFNENHYFDVTAEYCKRTPNDILGRYTIANRGPNTSTIHVLPTLWFRNYWDWGENCEAYISEKPVLQKNGVRNVACSHPTLCNFQFEFGPSLGEDCVPILFTENETCTEKVKSSFVKDAFHEYVINKKKNGVDLRNHGTKCCGHYTLIIEPGQEVVVKVRLYLPAESPPSGKSFSKELFDDVFQQRIFEADQFYDEVISFQKVTVDKDRERRLIARQAYAGLLWSKQFYYYIVREWLKGENIRPDDQKIERLRNRKWMHLFNKDIISVPDKWEFPWYASWDLAFHMVPMCNVDIEYAKSQLLLFLEESYMHPNGQIPAYEFAFDDVNPPVHAYAVLKVYRRSGTKGNRDVSFLRRCFHKLILKFNWWVNRKQVECSHIFTGGFLGLDNIREFIGSQTYNCVLAQADATAWMAFFCCNMLEISLILARKDPIYQDMSSKFFEHLIAIITAINNTDSKIGLWDDDEGFYYDHKRTKDASEPVKIKSVVGLVSLFSCLIIKDSVFQQLPEFEKKTKAFMKNRKDLVNIYHIPQEKDSIMLSVVDKTKLITILKHVLDKNKFLSDFGVRSLSKEHQDMYEPGESSTQYFGGNSNWRGPIWLPMNYLIIESLERFYTFFGDDLKVQFPTDSTNQMTLKSVANELGKCVLSLFEVDSNGQRPCHGEEKKYANDKHFKELILFYEYFHADTGRGCGASHQTGWTALIVNVLEKLNNEEDKGKSRKRSLKDEINCSINACVKKQRAF